MSTSDTKYSSFISHYGPAEFWNIEFVFQLDLVRGLLINIEEVNILCSPFEVVHKLAGTVAFFQDKRVLKEFRELVNYTDSGIVSDPTRKFPEFSFFSQ
jgi:hypothetical protein